MPDLFHFNQIFVRPAGTFIGKAFQKAQAEYKAIKTSGAYYSKRKPVEDKFLFLQLRQQLYRKAIEHIHKSIHPFTQQGGWQNPKNIRTIILKSIASIEEQLIKSKAASGADQIGIKALPEDKVEDSLSVKIHLKIDKQLPVIIEGIQAWQEWTKERLKAFVNVHFCQFSQQQSLKKYVLEYMLPWLYWQEILSRTPPKSRNNQLRAYYQQLIQDSANQYATHEMTKCLSQEQMQICIKWGESIVRSFQRSSSQVEGRNGYLAFIHQANRGIPLQRLKVLTVIHNFDIRRADGSTPAQRLFDYQFPNLFEHILGHVTGFREPRQVRAIL